MAPVNFNSQFYMLTFEEAKALFYTICFVIAALYFIGFNK